MIMAEPRIVRNGEGATVAGEQWLFKAMAENTDGLFDLMVGAVPRLAGPPLHVHATQSDTFLVLEGTLTIQVEDAVYDLAPGDLATVPPGVPHTFDNMQGEDEPVVVVNIMVPGGLHDFFKERSAVPADSTQEELGRLAQAHGMEVVGPPLRMRTGTD